MKNNQSKKEKNEYIKAGTFHQARKKPIPGIRKNKYS